MIWRQMAISSLNDVFNPVKIIGFNQFSGYNTSILYLYICTILTRLSLITADDPGAAVGVLDGLEEDVSKGAVRGDLAWIKIKI